jgi:hypothetical protein
VHLHVGIGMGMDNWYLSFALNIPVMVPRFWSDESAQSIKLPVFV